VATPAAVGPDIIRLNQRYGAFSLTGRAFNFFKHISFTLLILCLKVCFKSLKM